MTRLCAFNLCRFCAFAILFASVCCEVIVRESKIDPVTFLLESIERIDSIADRLQTLEATRSEEVNSLRIASWQSEEKLAQIYIGVSNMANKFDKLSTEISAIKSLYADGDRSKVDCICHNFPRENNRLFPVAEEEPLSKERRASKETYTENSWLTENETVNEAVVPMSTASVVNLVQLPEVNVSDNDSVSAESMILDNGVTLNNNIDVAIQKLGDIILHTSHTTNRKLDKQFLLDKSRENVSRALLNMISANQQMPEGHVEASVSEELQVLKAALFAEVREIKGVLGSIKHLFKETAQANEFIQVENETYDDYLSYPDDNDLLVRLNSLNTTNSSHSLPPLDTDALTNLTDVSNETLTADTIDLVVSFLGGAKDLTPTAERDTLPEKAINNHLTFSDKETSTNQTENCHHQAESKEGLTLESIFSLSNLTTSKILQNVKNLQTSISSRMKKAEEQIIGFKIYQSSALHSHMKEVRFELSKLREELSKSMAATGNKLGKKLESNKMSSFAFLNAAVTSITSSTVTSSKATGVAISKTLRNVFQMLQDKVIEMSWIGSAQCPGLYQKVGSSCLLVVQTMRASWIDTCKFCAELGGVIPQINKKDLSILNQILSNDTDGLWLRTENSSIQSDTCTEDNSLSLPADNLKIIERVCTAYMANGTVIESIPCYNQLSVICQRPIVTSSAISKDFNISTALSDLDFFLANSKYYKFRRSQL